MIYCDLQSNGRLTRCGLASNYDEGSTSNADHQYINVHRVTVMMNAILRYLGIKDAYNFFILNPTAPVDGDNIYGYRYLLSFYECCIDSCSPS